MDICCDLPQEIIYEIIYSITVLEGLKQCYIYGIIYIILLLERQFVLKKLYIYFLVYIKLLYRYYLLL